jgi:cellulose synthase/poly-beta-1,6-N-acetylglucosamine synthase-like glycosyltransferase
VIFEVNGLWLLANHRHRLLAACEVNRSRMRITLSKHNDSPLVSVILCPYNRAHLVKRAIASVLTQSYPNWELIIIDDGSADDTGQVVMPVVKSNPRGRLCSRN